MESLIAHLFLSAPNSGDLWKRYQPGQDEIWSCESVLHTPSDVSLASSSTNSDSDTIKHIAMLLAALTELGMLEQGLASLMEQMPSKLYDVVVHTTQEVLLRHRSLRHLVEEPDQPLLSLDEESKAQILLDLFWTMYSKFGTIIAMMQRLDTILVARNLPNGVRTKLNHAEIWRSFRNEVSSQVKSSIKHLDTSTTGDILCGRGDC